jgi:hypothetical protein
MVVRASSLLPVALAASLLWSGCGERRADAPGPPKTSEEMPSSTGESAPAAGPPGRVLDVSALESLEAYCEGSFSALCRERLRSEDQQAPAGCGSLRVLLDRVPMASGGSACRLLFERGRRAWQVETDLVCETSSYDATIDDQRHLWMIGARCAGADLTVDLLARDPGDGREAREHVACSFHADLPQCTATATVPLPPPAEVAEFVSEVTSAIERHEWDALLAMCSPAHREAQIEHMGQPMHRYLIEIIGAGMVDNNLGGGGSHADQLARIRSAVVFDVVATRRGTYVVVGRLLLDDGTYRRLTLEVRVEDGQPMLTGAVG